MKKFGRVVLIIVLISIVLGAVSAGVGFLTGADVERIDSVTVNRIERQFNVDPVAFVQEWVPEVAGILRDAVLR